MVSLTAFVFGIEFIVLTSNQIASQFVSIHNWCGNFDWRKNRMPSNQWAGDRFFVINASGFFSSSLSVNSLTVNWIAEIEGRRENKFRFVK